MGVMEVYVGPRPTRFLTDKTDGPDRKLHSNRGSQMWPLRGMCRDWAPVLKAEADGDNALSEAAPGDRRNERVHLQQKGAARPQVAGGADVSTSLA